MLGRLSELTLMRLIKSQQLTTRTNMEKINIHPEMAEPMIDQIIGYYVMAGLRVGLTPDWDRFHSSQFYEKGIQKFPKDAFDTRLAKMQKVAQFPVPEDYGAPGSVTDRVIRDYVNAGMGLGLPPDWDKFRTSQFYEACADQFTKDEVEKAIAEASGYIAPLDIPLGDILPPGFFSKS